MEEIIGYLLAVIVGISLGLIGSGGSILTVPILVYIMKVEPVNATAYSLFIVGATALVGGIKNAIEKNVEWKTAIIFGIPSIAAVYITRAIILPIIPKEILTIGGFIITKDIFLMMLFALVMILASYSMIKPSNKNEKNFSDVKYNFPMIFLEGTFVGVLTGLVGAGGGFLIIPALVLLARIPIKLAVGTSLLIIAAKSLLGFFGDLKTNPNMDFHLIGYFTLAAIMGMFIGIFLTKKIDGAKLKVGFGWFVLIMGIYILIKELFLK
ncbi:MAG: sulfite exporter TauE/SafE family protein [Chitinophagales bacterium]|nr:sulfite exporter TauE/SafE family protein [Chitinophagales bacterium]